MACHTDFSRINTQVDSLGSCFSQKLTRPVWGRLWVSAVTEGARREGGAPADGGSAQTPSARSPAPASREPVRPSVQPRLHRLDTRRPRRPPVDPACRGAAAVARLHRLVPRHPPAAGGSRAPPAGGRELRSAGARAEGRDGGSPRSGEERQQLLRRGGEGRGERAPAGGSASRGEERRRPAPRRGVAAATAEGRGGAVAAGVQGSEGTGGGAWMGSSGQREDEEGATGLSGKARDVGNL
ncbi:hypothetical protein PVAP13_7KG076054 [Panicum virgatum]|uniref:Uncharacterized protein n=1 Tax=Panicum virgatum TaxID=38727 RepID=A0A8T0QCP6_PANVG|nr:hypothetical protein PVAP13_7KG076054 [Panicum virgatum]